MKHLFGDGKKRPTLVCSLSDTTAPELAATMRNAIFDGAEAFLLHMELIEEQYRNRDSLAEVFKYAEDKPILTLDYRYKGRTDEDNAEMLLTSIDAGADYVDLYAGMFDKNRIEYTRDPDALARQREFIAKVHEKDAGVLCSCHLLDRFYEPAEVLEIGLEMESRGVEIVKLVTMVKSEEELLKGMYMTTQLRKNLKVPFLHICAGQCGKVHRALAPTLGSSMVLCVQRYTTRTNKDKPLLRATRTLYDSLDYKPYRS